MPLDAGRLRHRVVFQAPTQVQDPVTGAVVPTWATVATLWTAVEPLSAREFIQSQATQSQVTGKMIIRKNSLITATCRALFRNKVYNIHGVLDDPESGLEYSTLPTSEGVSDGE